MRMQRLIVALRTTLLGAALLANSAAPAAAEIQDLAPRFLFETRSVAPSGSPATQRFTAPDSPPLPAYRPPQIRLQMEILDTAQVDQPVRIAIQAYDQNGEPAVRFQEPVTFECALGVVPILATAPWINGAMVETVIITRPGRQARLGAVAGEVSVARYLDVAPPPLSRATWLAQAEEYLAQDRFADAIRAFTNAASLTAGGDAAIEDRLGRIYLQRGQWAQAQVHFRNAIRITMTSAP